MNCPRCGSKVDMIGAGDWRAPVYRCYENRCRWAGSIDTPEAWKESGTSVGASRANAAALEADIRERSGNDLKQNSEN